MSTQPESIAINHEIKISLSTSTQTIFNNNRCPGHVLKPKNIFKSNKCNIAFKRKLKKYKLRKDGKEDQDILNISQILLSKLKIKSPSNLPSFKSQNQEQSPKNYLNKMARRKQKAKPVVSNNILKCSKDIVAGDSLIKESEDSKKTNAFKLLMDSRNKSIGSNSPGKEKVVELSEEVDIIEKKTLKVKRKLALQKMADNKGALNKKEMVEYQEKCIQRKMEKRKERLKNMIVKQNINHEVTKEIPKLKTTKITKDELLRDNNIIKSKAQVATQTKALLVNIFNDDTKSCNADSFKKKHIPKEEEFLKKLSPSIKKKENMLCYFKKIEKPDVVNDIECEDCVPIIKMKSKKINKKLRLIKNCSNDTLKDCNENNSCNTNDQSIECLSIDSKSVGGTNERRKRKRKKNVFNQTESLETVDTIELQDARPKRNVKKPIKYNDDAHITSSDEELQIFTPKKRKHIENKTRRVTLDKHERIVNISDEESEKKSKNVKKNAQKVIVKKNTAKLAPIFASKPQRTPQEIEAKQKFLHSGIPDKLKKIIAQQRKENTELYNIFSIVVHVQQTILSTSDKCETTFLTSYDDYEESKEELVLKDDKLFRKLLSLNKMEISTGDIKIPEIKTVHSFLQSIKKLYPKFPVYRSYRLLKEKSKGEYKDYYCTDLENSIEVIDALTDAVHENPESLTWTDKYKALSTKQLIGNFDTIKELKKWLISSTENEIKQNISSMCSDSSDFYDSDADSTDSLKTINNLLVLTGPVGSGKTSCVYAVASELAIKVIEVNASSKRTGKIMLQDLQEATQSHKVNRGTGSSENSQRSQETIDCSNSKYNNKKGRTINASGIPLKKYNSIQKTDISQSPVSQENVRTGMSLILIDDADIVFDQDDGFSSAIAQLTQSSKRPVILITSSLTCPHLQRFIQCGKIMTMHPLLPRMLGTWLDIMCLADNSMCWPGLGEKILDFFKGDIRKTINCLQFYITTIKNLNQEQDTASQNDFYKSFIDDENSGMSWADHEPNTEERILKSKSSLCEDAWKSFMGKQSNLQLLQRPLELFNIWWSVPSLLSDVFCHRFEGAHNSASAQQSVTQLKAIVDVTDSFSVADYVIRKNQDNRINISSQPWCGFESDSVSELESLDNYCRNHETSNEILHNLVTGFITVAQTTLQIENKTDINFPTMAMQRERNRILSRHENLTSFLNPSAVMDRKALALDYWPSCRTICRIEKTKTDTKRNNRHYHYLKSFNVLCKTDSFDKLCESLCCQGEDK